MINKAHLLCIALAIVLYSCQEQSQNAPLPKIGQIKIEGGDTLYHKIAPFEFLDQDSNKVVNAQLSESIYLSDFFFMSCPSICPIVKKQMLRIYDKFENDNVKLVSHTLDPKRDTPSKLKQYASNLNVNHEKWLFLSGDKAHTYDIKDSYLIAAEEDPEAPGGINHSGKIVLVDKAGHIRSFAEGTDPDEVNRLMKDVRKLLQEYK